MGESACLAAQRQVASSHDDEIFDSPNGASQVRWPRSSAADDHMPGGDCQAADCRTQACDGGRKCAPALGPLSGGLPIDIELAVMVPDDRVRGTRVH
jgi:hypothetical protein